MPPIHLDGPQIHTSTKWKAFRLATLDGLAEQRAADPQTRKDLVRAGAGPWYNVIPSVCLTSQELSQFIQKINEMATAGGRNDWAGNKEHRAFIRDKGTRQLQREQTDRLLAGLVSNNLTKLFALSDDVF